MRKFTIRHLLPLMYIAVTIGFSQNTFSQCAGSFTYNVNSAVNGVNYNLNAGQSLKIGPAGSISGGSINLNGGSICNQGTIQPGVNINANSGIINNFGVFNRSSFTLPSGLQFFNYNVVNVTGNFIINSGSTWWEDGKTTVGGTIHVNGIVNGSPNICGQIIIAGYSTVNSGALINQIDFCDLGNPALHADVANGFFGPTTTFCLCNFSPLPVELIGFAGEASGEEIALSWSTASEQNNEGFYLERSSDMIHFEEIAAIPGCGNCNELNTYKYTDKQPAYGNNYYRLLQKDYNASKEVIGTVAVKREMSESDVLTSLGYGNYQLRYYSAEGNAVLQVITMDGKVLVQENHPAADGINTLDFSLPYPQVVVVMLLKPDGSQTVLKCMGN